VHDNGSTPLHAEAEASDEAAAAATEELHATEDASTSAAASSRAVPTPRPPPRFAPNDVVYLTPDTDETLDELEEGKLYVIGGIVDRNRHKVCVLSTPRLSLSSRLLLATLFHAHSPSALPSISAWSVPRP
jgi:hypothetical protein